MTIFYAKKCGFLTHFLILYLLIFCEFIFYLEHNFMFCHRKFITASSIWSDVFFKISSLLSDFFSFVKMIITLPQRKCYESNNLLLLRVWWIFQMSHLQLEGWIQVATSVFSVTFLQVVALMHFTCFDIAKLLLWKRKHI
jgi:hypothetical protein